MNRNLIPALCIVGVACSAGEDATSTNTVFSTSGDTIVATTSYTAQPETTRLVPEQVIGDADGAEEYMFAGIGDVAVGLRDEVLVWDWRSHLLRLYDSSGTFLRHVGRKGAGPGEFDRLNGIAIRGDGKIVVWDAGNGRINVYSSLGDFERSFRLSVGYFTNRAVSADSADGTFLRTTVRRDSAQRLGISGILRFNGEGIPVDSVEPPAFGAAPPQLVATRPSAMVSYPVPNYPSPSWTMNRRGELVAGPGDPYVVYVLPRNGQPVKIVRDIAGPAVDPDEQDEQRAFTLAMLRMSVPEYQWNGPSVRNRKPAYRSIHVDLDNRIWVQVSQPSERIPEEDRVPAPNPPNPRALPPSTWQEPTAYDVFARDGHFLGHVRMPRRAVLYQARGNRVWATTLDSLDIPSVTRFRIAPPLAQPPEAR